LDDFVRNQVYIGRLSNEDLRRELIILGFVISPSIHKIKALRDQEAETTKVAKSGPNEYACSGIFFSCEARARLITRRLRRFYSVIVVGSEDWWPAHFCRTSCKIYRVGEQIDNLSPRSFTYIALHTAHLSGSNKAQKYLFYPNSHIRYDKPRMSLCFEETYLYRS
jgi:hypothetical protein